MVKSSGMMFFRFNTNIAWDIFAFSIRFKLIYGGLRFFSMSISELKSGEYTDKVLSFP